MSTKSLSGHGSTRGTGCGRDLTFFPLPKILLGRLNWILAFFEVLRFFSLRFFPCQLDLGLLGGNKRLAEPVLSFS